MTDRIRLDELTSDDLDQLYNQLDRARHATDPELRRQLAAAIKALGHSETELARLRADITLDQAQQWPQRLGRVEAAIARVRDWAAGLDTIAVQVAGEGTRHPVADHIRHLLDQTTEPAATEATEPDSPALRELLADTIREFGWDNYGLNDIDIALHDHPDDQEWVPAHADGEFIVLGPEIFASSDGAVISWKGDNYVRQSPEPAATGPHILCANVRPGHHTTVCDLPVGHGDHRGATGYGERVSWPSDAEAEVVELRERFDNQAIAATELIAQLADVEQQRNRLAATLEQSARTAVNNPATSGDAANNPLRTQFADVLRPWLLGADEADVEHCADAILAIHRRETAQLRRERDMALKAAREARGDVAHDAGPSVAECRDHDRAWDVEREAQ